MIALDIISLMLPAPALRLVKGLRLRRAHMGERGYARGALDGPPFSAGAPLNSEMMAGPCQLRNGPHAGYCAVGSDL